MFNFNMRRTRFWLPAFLILFLVPVTVFAVSSASYTIDPSDSAAVRQTTSSTSYQLEGSIEPITGKTTSTSYAAESGASFKGYCGDGAVDPTEDCDGANLNSKTCVTQGFASGTLSCSSACIFVTSGCASSGGRDITPVETAPPAPTFDSTITARTFIYLSEMLFFGTKAVTATGVYVNDTTEGVTYVTTSRWQKTLTLSLGDNTIAIKAFNSAGESSAVSHTLKRRKFGDANDNGQVNDYDFSLLANHWGENWPEADFNADNQVNDYDLSLMGANWSI